MEYDCQQCGACCVDYFGTSGYISLKKGEVERMRRLSLPVVNWQGQVLLGTRVLESPLPGPLSAEEGEVRAERCCVAFAGTVGGSCTCSIYQDRPAECRAFEVGSLGCRFARQEFGLPC